MRKFYDERGHFVTETELQAEFEQMENPDGRTFEQYIEACMDHNGGTLEAVGNGPDWAVEFTMNGETVNIGEGWGLSLMVAERIVEDLEYQGIEGTIVQNDWDFTE